jgi:phospholipid-binding lipoprotein MlaA
LIPEIQAAAMIQRSRSFARGWILLTSSLFVAGCASAPSSDDEEVPVRAEYDPLERLNRGLYNINDAFDRVTLKPIARGYKAVVPEFARRGVTNFSRNLFTPRSAVNNFLQGKPGPGFSELGRFIINSTLGIGGLIDVASAQGMPEYDEDFGQTLAVWGIPEGPYLFIPILGPNTLLDAVSTPIDIVSDPLYHYDNSSVRDKVYALRVIDLRMRLLTAEQLLEDSKDPYLTLRESYLQNRRFQVYDGNPPSTEEEDDLFDEFFEEE